MAVGVSAAAARYRSLAQLDGISAGRHWIQKNRLDTSRFHFLTQHWILDTIFIAAAARYRILAQLDKAPAPRHLPVVSQQILISKSEHKVVTSVESDTFLIHQLLGVVNSI